MITKSLILAAPIIGMLTGFFFLLKPARLIEIQRRFYEKINWRIEPVSMPKELRNTRIMGSIIIVFSLAALIFCLVKGLAAF
jgi:hypothetical protein